MATAIDTTKWPAISIPMDIKTLISLYFSLVETKDSCVGNRLATDIFTPDGTFSSPHATAAGSSEIARSRDHVWDTVDARQHIISKVYANNAEGLDLFLLGTLNQTLKNGEKTEAGFVARMVIVRRGNAAEPKLKSYQAAGWK